QYILANESVKLTLETQGLESMKGQHYEGWNIINGKAISTGRFSITQKGQIYSVKTTGEKLNKIGEEGIAHFELSKNHSQATLFVLTIEPNNDSDPNPSTVHVLGGEYSNYQASLSIAHGSSLGSDFSNASGSYILAAPTGGNPNQGVWFVNPQQGIGALELPELPMGWAYEGWIVNTKNNKKFSTGIFQNPQQMDSDGAGPYAGPLKLSFPRVPGQDIVATPVVLDDGIHAVVVTVEPYPDYDPAPYAIKILKSDIEENAQGMVNYPLENISPSAPSGSVHIH
ncbi:MAG: hypothetical protein KDD40_11370, partial [Bdellovibrionales bacterium]|nr:hypothetical protein [Bdellovibrionales bacterium]